MKTFLNRSRTISLCFFAFFLVVVCVLAAIASNGWLLIQPAPYVISFMGLTVSAGIFFVLLLRYFIKNTILRTTVTIVLCLLFIVILAGVLLYGGLIMEISNSAHYVYTSPSGRNQLVVIEGGYIDAVIQAYPLHGIFYRTQENGTLSYHDLWTTENGKRIQVEWVSDSEAMVRLESMNYMRNEKSNENGRIRVYFE